MAKAVAKRFMITIPGDKNRYLVDAPSRAEAAAHLNRVSFKGAQDTSAWTIAFEADIPIPGLFITKLGPNVDWRGSGAEPEEPEEDTADMDSDEF